MRASKLHMPTLRDAAAQEPQSPKGAAQQSPKGAAQQSPKGAAQQSPKGAADSDSTSLLLRAGMVRRLGPGSYAWLPLGTRVLRKLENLVRGRMEKLGGQETRLPLLEPRRALEKSGRWDVLGEGTAQQSPKGIVQAGEHCLPPSYEESALESVLHDVRSYKQLPLLLHQFGPRSSPQRGPRAEGRSAAPIPRDGTCVQRHPEGRSAALRPQRGVIRAREYHSHESYSLHADDSSADAMVAAVLKEYAGLLEELGLKPRLVEAETGGYGLESHALMVPADSDGPSAADEVFASCSECSYAAALERAESWTPEPGPSSPPAGPALEEVSTPGRTTVADVAELLGVGPESLLKTQLYMAAGKPVMALVRGDHALCEAKLQAALGPVRLTRATPGQYEQVAGCVVGFAGPVNLPRWKTPDGRMEAVRILADLSTRGMGPAVSGANKPDAHLKNILAGRDFAADRYEDLRLAQEGDACPRCSKGKLTFSKGIPVARASKLGTRLSETFGAVYTDREQERKPMHLCRSSLGLSRLAGVLAEFRHDKDGLLWPAAAAPFSVAVMPLSLDDRQVVEHAVAVYEALLALGVDALLEDRDERPGVRFKDLDLIGIPLRLVVSKKGLAAGQVELKSRERSSREPLSIGIGGPAGVAATLAERLKALL